MGQKIWKISCFLNLVKHYFVDKFYKTIAIITNKKGHQKQKEAPEMDFFGTL